MKNAHSDISLFMRFEPDIPKLTHQNGLKTCIVNGHSQVYKSPELRDLESKYMSFLKPYAPDEPWDCPINLVTFWYFRMPKKCKKYPLRSPDTYDEQYWKTTKPDTENLLKTLKDCMQRIGFFADDACVCLDTIGKVYVPEDKPHGILIKIHDLMQK